MANKDFSKWMSKFRDSIFSYSYYVNFQKVLKNAEKYKVELNILNSLIGSKNIRKEFIRIVKKYPEVLKSIPILVAVRSNEIEIAEGKTILNFNFKKPNYSVEQYSDFMEKIGLFDMMSNRITNNLYDYVLGVETGLDSNGRKNRGGNVMEDYVENYLKKTGKVYHRQMDIKKIEKKYGLDLSAISNNGGSSKRIDFILEGKNCIYAIEVNFYYKTGSKIYETARSYKMIAEESSTIKKFQFVWITDGKGWYSAKGNLKETFDVMEHIYSLDEVDKGILNSLK